MPEWRGNSIFIDLVQNSLALLSPRLACRWTDFHKWKDGKCKYCQMDVHGKLKVINGDDENATSKVRLAD